MKQIIFKSLLTGSCLLTGSLSIAAVTVNGSGSYATVSEALNNASAGAVLEITDSATYTENVHITLNSITIRAAAGQTPTIAGVAAPHPVAATSMPVKWHGGDQDTTFNANGATVVNSGTGTTLQGLILDAGAADGALDLRFGTATVQSSTINAAGKVAGVLTRGDQLLTAVTINGGTDSIISQGTGVLTIANSTVNGGGRAASFLGGTINASNTSLIDNTATGGYGVHFGNAFGSATANFDHVVFRSDATATAGRGRILIVIDNSGPAPGGNFPGGTWGDGTLSLTADHSDFISSRDPATGDFLDSHAINVNTGRVGWVMNNLTVTNSNFYGQNSSPLNMGGSINEPSQTYFGIRPDEITVTNNYFYETINNIEDQCDVLGNYGWCARNDESNVQSWGPWDPLYVNVQAGNYQVASDSPAATAASDGGPTGALGVGSTAVKNYTERTVAQSGPADFTSIQAAYDAAVDGDVITILDSATYNENLLFNSKKDISLRSNPSLATRPVVSGTAAQAYTLNLSTAGSQRVTIMSIAFDGSNLPAGARAFQFDDAGQSAVINCTFTTAGSTDWCFYMTGTRGRIFTGCEVQHATPGFGAVLQGGGLVKFQDSTLTSTVSGAGFVVMNGPLAIDMDNITMNTLGSAFQHRQGTVDVRHSHLASNWRQVVDMTITGKATFRSFFTIIECAGGAPALGANREQWGITTAAGTNVANIIVDNSDIFGGPDGTVGVWLRDDGDRAVIKDSIVSNFAVFAFHHSAPSETAAQLYSGWSPNVAVMDYNVLVNAPDGHGVAGPNSIIAPSLESVYVDAPNDFHLTDNSLAIGVNSSGVPNWAGSQGPANPLSHVSDWVLYQ